MSTTRYKFLAAGAFLVFCLLLEALFRERAAAGQAEAIGDDERLAAAQERIRQIEGLIGDQQECQGQIWMADTSVIRNSNAPPSPADMAAQGSIEPRAANGGCSCELLVNINEQLEPINGTHEARPNELVSLEAECSPSGGTYSWDFSGGDDARLVGGVTNARAAFVSEIRSTYKVKVTYTLSEEEKCGAEANISTE